MPSPSSFFQELDSRRATLAQMRRDLEIQEAELRGMEYAAQFMPQSGQPIPATEETLADVETKRDGMRISVKWRTVLQQLAAAYPSDSPLDEIKRNALSAGVDVNDNTLRAQMATYANAGYVERTRVGRFRLTQSGADAVGFPFDLALMQGGMSHQQMRDAGIIPQHAVGMDERPTPPIPPENTAVLTEMIDTVMEGLE